MISALTASSSSLVSTDTTSLLMTRIAERMYGTMRERTDAIDAAYEAKLDAVSARRGTVAGRLRDAEKVVESVDKAKELIDEIKGFLLDMKKIISKVEDSPTASELYAKQFNDKIKEINQTANRYSGDYNLVGHPNDITLAPEAKTIQIADFGTNLSVQALYAGTSFNIVGTGADAGLFYKNKPTSNVMYKVDSLSDTDPLAVVANDKGSVSNVDTSGGDGAIEFDVAADGTQVHFSGTLKKGGLGLMPSWYYGELSTTDGVAAAKQAIRDAEAQLRKVSASVTSVNSKVQPKVRALEQEKQVLVDQKADLARDQFMKVAELEDETRAQYSAIETSLNNQSNALSGYQSILRGAASGAFLDMIS